MSRRLVGWRVRWEYLTLHQEWVPGQEMLMALPYALREAALLRGRKGEYRDVRVMRVWRVKR